MLVLTLRAILKNVHIDSGMQAVAEFLRKCGVGKLVHAVKRSGITDVVRTINTERTKEDVIDVRQYKKYFKDDVQKVQDLTGIGVVTQWKYD